MTAAVTGVSLMLASAMLLLSPLPSEAATYKKPADSRATPPPRNSTIFKPVKQPDIKVSFKNLSCSYNSNLQKYVVNFKAKIENFSGNPTWNLFKTKVSSPNANLQAALAMNPGNPKSSPAPMSGWTEWGYGSTVDSPGKYTLKLEADFQSAQPESNENNNKAQKSVACK